MSRTSANRPGMPAGCTASSTAVVPPRDRPVPGAGGMRACGGLILALNGRTARQPAATPFHDRLLCAGRLPLDVLDGLPTRSHRHSLCPQTSDQSTLA